MKNAVPFYRAVAGLSVDEQRVLCESVAKKSGMKLSEAFNADEDEDALSEWRRGLSQTDVALVANLLAIPDWRAKKSRPSAVLGEVLADVTSRGIVIVSAQDAVSSVDGRQWARVVHNAFEALAMGGRKMPREHYVRMGRKSAKRRPPGVVKRWHSKAMRPMLERWRDRWRSADYHSAEAAWLSMPVDVREDIGSFQSAKRVFGRSYRGSGGRPRNKSK